MHDAAELRYVDQLDLHAALESLSVIHVAGTKGKGSTSAFCESVLRHRGCTTGLFTSPHLVDVRERIRINGKPVSKEARLSYGDGDSPARRSG